MRNLIIATSTNQTERKIYKNDECPVFDACHEEFPDSWGSLYKNFTEMLEACIVLNGDIETTSYDSPTAAEFINENKKG